MLPGDQCPTEKAFFFFLPRQTMDLLNGKSSLSGFVLYLIESSGRRGVVSPYQSNSTFSVAYYCSIDPSFSVEYTAWVL